MPNRKAPRPVTSEPDPARAPTRKTCGSPVARRRAREPRAQARAKIGTRGLPLPSARQSRRRPGKALRVPVGVMRQASAPPRSSRLWRWRFTRLRRGWRIRGRRGRPSSAGGARSIVAATGWPDKATPQQAACVIFWGANSAPASKAPRCSQTEMPHGRGGLQRRPSAGCVRRHGRTGLTAREDPGPCAAAATTDARAAFRPAASAQSRPLCEAARPVTP